MDRRIAAINNWVTARYFKKSDVETFIRNLEFFAKKGIKIHPVISISVPTGNRRTADIILSSGINEKDAKEKIGAEKLLLQYSWNEQYKLNTLLDEKAVLSAMKKQNGASIIFEKVASYVKEVTDSGVEMRGIQ